VICMIVVVVVVLVVERWCVIVIDVWFCVSLLRVCWMCILVVGLIVDVVLLSISRLGLVM